LLVLIIVIYPVVVIGNTLTLVETVWRERVKLSGYQHGCFIVAVAAFVVVMSAPDQGWQGSMVEKAGLAGPESLVCKTGPARVVAFAIFGKVGVPS
jgi:hypothetical protein